MRLLPVAGRGPEDVALDAAGRLLTGLEDGWVLRLSADGETVEVIAETGGRPLGVEVDRDGRIVVCDAERGLLRIDPDDGRIVDLVAAGDDVGGTPMGLCNNAAIALDGTIYFSDSSQRFALRHWEADLLEHSGTGRLIRRDPDGSCHELLTGLHFANGVALPTDESFVVVAETGAYRLTRLWLAGDRAGEVDRMVDNLPGFPDNISTGSDGLIWIALASPRSAALDLVSPRHPVLRRAVWALPAVLRPKPVDTVWVQAVNDTGQVVHDLQAKLTGLTMVTGVREHDGTVWLGNLHGDAIGVVTLP